MLFLAHLLCSGLHCCGSVFVNGKSISGRVQKAWKQSIKNNTQHTFSHLRDFLTDA